MRTARARTFLQIKGLETTDWTDGTAINMNNHSKHAINVSSMSVLSNDPDGTGAIQMPTWKSKLFTCAEASGRIILSVLKGDDTLIRLVRPDGDIPS